MKGPWCGVKFNFSLETSETDTVLLSI